MFEIFTQALDHDLASPRPKGRSERALIPVVVAPDHFLLVEPHEGEGVAPVRGRGLQDVLGHLEAVLFEDDRRPVGERS